MTAPNRELTRLAVALIRDELRWVARCEAENEATTRHFEPSPKLTRLALLHDEAKDRLAAAMRHRRTFWVRAGDRMIFLDPQDCQTLCHVPAEPGPIEPADCPKRYPYLAEPAP